MRSRGCRRAQLSCCLAERRSLTRLLCGLLKKYELERVESTREVFVDRLVPLDHDFEIGAPVVEVDGTVMLPLRDGLRVPVAPTLPGIRGGRVEEFHVQEDTAIIKGWAFDTKALIVPRTVVLTEKNRIWALAQPSIERAGSETGQVSKSGFRLFVCGFNRADFSDFRAYAWWGTGSLVELEQLSTADR